ncbi:tripartite motif containing 105 [Hypomesus transpacificus]|uniref:tripartite motif containing 105 n=1 Tax=Hypomesus transpacificus TaxID=137520 RepID=UPI001F085588|nr:tripartite motif containing 105 [Hypomesus transpacificus]
MAAGVGPNKISLREDLTCAICCDLFTEPVMLGCAHHFCKACISRYWRGTQGPVTCPQCRKVFNTKQFQTNYLVTAMVDKVRASTSDSFVQKMEKQLKDSLEAHRLRREEAISSIRRDEDKMDAIKRVGGELQARVQGEFLALQQLLQDEEARLQEQLRREQEEVLEQLQRHLELLQSSVKELEHNITVLQQAAAASDHSMLIELPQIRPPVHVANGPELDISAFSSKYVAPLQYITWRKMFTSLKPGPAPVTFDSDTAHPSVHISRDKTLAIECNVMAPYPLNPKRFLQCVNVLACQGFQSGRHYWEVRVGSNPKWDLGLASEGVNRQTRVKLSPETGYWTLRLRNGDEYWAGTQPWTRLQLTCAPQRIGVFLDCEERRVSFFNAENMTLLYSFTNGPRGTAFPFFSPCISNTRQTPLPIQLLHFPPAILSG